MTAAAVSLDGVRAGYRGITILDGVTLDVAAGAVVGVFGANGAGKTTLLRTVSGLTQVFAGEIRVGERRTDGLAAHVVARLGVAHVPEGRRVFAGMSVLDNLTVSARSKALDRPLARVYDLFPRLRERLSQRADTLSGGEQQMLAIGRAMMSEPRLIMMDEPSQGLSPAAVDIVMSSVAHITASDVTVVIVEQNVNVLLPIVDSAIVVSRGQVRQLRSTAELTKENLVALLTDAPAPAGPPARPAETREDQR